MVRARVGKYATTDEKTARKQPMRVYLYFREQRVRVRVGVSVRVRV